MRDIKFRCWVFPTKKEIKEDPYKELQWMFYFENPSIGDGSCLIFNEKGGLSLDEDDRKFEIMQYTGLKDKNGVEIFEGDILEQAGIVSWNDVEVRWSCIDISLNDRREWHDMLYLTTPLEVIGNIYENPELLANNK
jgi:uncharacterized phage protein (TIGR01671 family)